MQSQLMESSQTWWLDDDNGFITFQNMTNQPLKGIVLKVDEGACNTGAIFHYRNLIFSYPMSTQKISAFKFLWPINLSRKWRCIDIVGAI